MGDKVFFNFGTDEHGLKIYQKAAEEGKDPQKYCDEYAAKFDALKRALNLSYNNFIRTTDSHHIQAAQEFWKRCDAKGDIYKKNYRAKYCVGCELEKTDSELIDGRCPIHPNRELETIEEENYFFRFSKYQQPLLDFYDKNSDFVIPESKFKEIRTFVEGGLQDFSISRLKSKMPWGIDVPNDPQHVMFVWFDALVNYVSAVGWPDNQKKFETWWPVVQFAGKDNLRQQTAIWQAMLISAGLPNSKQVFIHGFITADGQKISKSLGNVINPFDLVAKYGTDAVRYYLLAKINPYDDSDFTIARFEEAYNADLANGLGNLVARVAKLAENAGLSGKDRENRPNRIIDDVELHLKNYRFDTALGIIFGAIGGLDNYIDKERPWTQKGDQQIKTLSNIIVGSETLTSILEIAEALTPFLPETAKKILKQFSGKIVSQPPLFPRIG